MLHENIKKLRKQSYLTQSELGKEIGVSKSTISMYESGERTPSLDILAKMAVRLGTNVDTLLGEKEKIPDEPKLTEEDAELLGLIKLMPQDMKVMYREALRAALKSQGLI